MRFWLDRGEMLWRRQHPTPGSFEEFIQAKRWIGTGPKYEDGYDYIAHQEDTEDRGSLYRMHILRQQAAFDLQTSVGEHGYITEQDIDSYHEPDKGEEERTHAARQKAQATMDMIRASLSGTENPTYHLHPGRAQYHCPRHRSTTGTSSTTHCRHNLT